MKIQAYILAHQEEAIIAYTMKHYRQFSDVILMEGHSTDRTVEIAESYGARIMKVDTHDQVNDQIYLDVKNNCWKGSDADWVIIVDTDEFVYHPNLVSYLESTESVIFRPMLFNMYSEVYPTCEGQIYDEVKYGVEGGGKTNLFKPSEILEINYLPGCHNSRPILKNGDPASPNINSEIMTLHFKNLSRQHVIERNAYLYSRLSEVNKRFKWGWHVGKGAEAVNEDFDNVTERLLKIL